MSLNAAAASRVRHLSTLNRYAIAQAEAAPTKYTANQPNKTPPAANSGAPDVSSNARIDNNVTSMSRTTETLLIAGGVILLGWIYVRSS
jgi:hypothetical protein